MATKPRNTRKADDEGASATTTAPGAMSGGAPAASAEAGVAASAALAADSIGGDAGQGDAGQGDAGQADTLAGGEAGDAITGADSLAVTGVIRGRSMIDELVDTALETVDALRSLLATIDGHLDELDPNARELLRQDTLALERFLRDRRPADAPAPAAPAPAEVDQPTKAQAAAAVKIPESEVFAWRWDGEQLTVVTVAGQKLRFRP